jgi:4-hydroxy-tetrahydrodipicolinate synthase
MKKKVIFKGCATALVTPFTDGEIDYAALASIIEYGINGGIDTFVIGGTTGEAATLSDKEREAVFSYTAEVVRGRKPLIFGIGTNDTRRVIERAKIAERIGCQGLLTVTPYYNKGTFPGVTRHYKSIAESTDLPIILYNVPIRTGVNLTYEQLLELSEVDNIVGIKEASDSADRLVELSTLREKLCLYAGNDSQIYTALSLGGFGVISVISNIMPKETSEICKLYFEGLAEKSLARQLELLPLIKLMFKETNPTPIKYAMSKMGLCTSEMRLPLAEAEEETRKLIDRMLKDTGLTTKI